MRRKEVLGSFRDVLVVPETPQGYFKRSQGRFWNPRRLKGEFLRESRVPGVSEGYFEVSGVFLGVS